jgi:peptidoglycan-associated lipoprotein
MSKKKLAILIQLNILLFALSGCCRPADDVWDDTKTAGRHMCRGFKSLAGKHGDSRQVRCREDFMRCQENEFCEGQYSAMEFEPFPGEIAMVEPKYHPSRPRVEPGQTARVPGIDDFEDPQYDVHLRNTFQTIYFPYNSSLIKGNDNMARIRAISVYMKNNPQVYLFVEGHCDERGAEAYNLALGTKRSNSIRNLLVKEGVNPENIYSVSYGKERPKDFGHNEDAWAKNRRAEFKIYDSRS